MSYKHKRFLIAAQAAFGTFWKVFQIQHYDDPRLFKKKYPIVDATNSTIKDDFSLTPKERIFFLEKEIHKLRCEIMENEYELKGRLTKEQSFFLCLFKKELTSIKSGYIY